MSLPISYFWEHEGNRAIRSGKWKLVSRTKDVKKFTDTDEKAWKLYDIEKLIKNDTWTSQKLL